MAQKAKVFALFDQGMKPSNPEVKALGVSSKTRYNYYQLWKKSAGAGQLTAMPKGQTLAIPVGKETDEITETSVLKLVPQVHSITLTPDIFISYMWALKTGFGGGIDRFLSIVARDFWEGRGIDPYKQVSGIDSSKR